MRSLIDVAYMVTEAAYDEGREAVEVLDHAEREIMAIGNSAMGSHKFTPISSKIDSTWERIEALSKKEDGIRGVPTGFKSLDNML